MEQQSRDEMEKLAWEVCHRGHTNLKQGKIEAALSDLRVAIPLLTDYAWPLICLGAALLAQEEFVQAEKAFQDALKKPANEANKKVFAQAREGLEKIANQKRALELYALAKSLFKEGNLNQAIQTYTQAITLVGVEKLPNTVCDRGYAYLKQGKIEAALADLRVAIPLLAEYSWPLILLGEALFAQNDLRGAENAFQNALRKPPTKENEKVFAKARAGLEKVRKAERKSTQKILDRNALTSTLGSNVQLSGLERLRGLYIIGIPGTGKSTLLESLILQDIEQGLGVCLVEPHGDLTQSVLSRIPKRREEDVIYLDLMELDLPFGLNLFDCNDPTNIAEIEFTKSFVMHVFQKLLGAGEQTPQLNRLLRNITYTLLSNPGTTFLEIPSLLLDKTVRENLVVNVRNRHVRQFWEDFYEKIPERNRHEFTNSILNRVDVFAASPLLQTIVGQGRTTMDFRRIMDEGKILLVQLPPRVEDVANLIGSVIVGKFLDAAYSRKDLLENERRQFHLYADEFQRFAVQDFATFFIEARKFGVGLTVAHQERGDLDRDNRRATLGVANIVVFQVTPEDAEELAGKFDRTPPPAWEEEIAKARVEVIREPYVETLEPERIEQMHVEVIDGVEPVKAVSQSPLDHILKSSHMSGEVREIRETFISPLKLAIEHAEEYERKKLQIVYYLLNNLLVYMMEQKDAFSPKVMIERIADIFLSLHQFSEITSQTGLTNYVHDDMRQKIIDFVSAYYQKWMSAENSEWGNYTQLLLYEAKRGLQKYIVDDNKREGQVAEVLGKVEGTISQIIRLCLAVKENPILVATGQEQPRKRNQVHIIHHQEKTLVHSQITLTHPRQTILHPQRTYQDMHNQRAAELAVLPKYTAKVRTEAGEYTIVTSVPQMGMRESALQERKDRVRLNNQREGYLRSREVVEKEIIERQSILESRGRRGNGSRRAQTTLDDDE